MPLTGVRCCQTGEDESFEHCMGCALTGTPHQCIHPFPLIAFMQDKDESRPAARSVTQLLGCASQSILKEKIDYTEDPANMWAMFRGSLGHEMMGRFARYVPDGFMEERLYAFYAVEGEPGFFVLTGQPDWVVPIGGKYVYEVALGGEDLIARDCIITDFKSSRNPVSLMKAPKPDHIKQVRMYADMLWRGRLLSTGEEKRWRAVEGRITYFDMDGSRTFSFPIDVNSELMNEVVDLLRPIAVYERTLDLPPVLPRRVVKGRNGTTQVTDHPLCGYCPVRTECFALEAEGK